MFYCYYEVCSCCTVVVSLWYAMASTWLTTLVVPYPPVEGGDKKAASRQGHNHLPLGFPRGGFDVFASLPRWWDMTPPALRQKLFLTWRCYCKYRCYKLHWTRAFAAYFWCGPSLTGGGTAIVHRLNGRQEVRLVGSVPCLSSQTFSSTKTCIWRNVRDNQISIHFVDPKSCANLPR